VDVVSICVIIPGSKKRIGGGGGEVTSQRIGRRNGECVERGCY
jgi:hypothetical protein